MHVLFSSSVHLNTWLCFSRWQSSTPQSTCSEVFYCLRHVTAPCARRIWCRQSLRPVGLSQSVPTLTGGRAINRTNRSSLQLNVYATLFTRLATLNACTYYVALPTGRIKCCICLSVCPTAPFLRFSQNRKATKTSNLVEKWKHSAGQEKLGEQIWGLKVKGQGHWERERKNRFHTRVH